MGVINLGFDTDRKITALALRISELEARQARVEKTLARQRQVNEAPLALMESVAAMKRPCLPSHSWYRPITVAIWRISGLELRWLLLAALLIERARGRGRRYATGGMIRNENRILTSETGSESYEADRAA